MPCTPGQARKARASPPQVITDIARRMGEGMAEFITKEVVTVADYDRCVILRAYVASQEHVSTVVLNSTSGASEHHCLDNLVSLGLLVDWRHRRQPPARPISVRHCVPPPPFAALSLASDSGIPSLLLLVALDMTTFWTAGSSHPLSRCLRAGTATMWRGWWGWACRSCGRPASGSGRTWRDQDALSNHMGLFLQKTNIIRDYLEDISEVRPQPWAVSLDLTLALH